MQPKSVSKTSIIQPKFILPHLQISINAHTFGQDGIIAFREIKILLSKSYNKSFQA